MYDIIKGYNFISFDISVRSTGWCRYYEGVFEKGSFGLQSQTELERRMEFRQQAIKLIDNKQYDFIAIEDVIAGTNFETTKILIQLNSIIDDLCYLGIVPQSPIERIGNTVWKRYLKEVSGYQGIKGGFVKSEIKRAINMLGYNEDVVQDIYDSIGIAIGVIQRRNDTKPKKTVKLKDDLSKSYVFYEYSEEKLYELSHEKGYEAITLKYDSSLGKDMLQVFKHKVQEIGDNYVFVLDCPREKYGVLGLTSKLRFGDYDDMMIAIKK